MRSSIEIVAEYRSDRTVVRTLRGGIHFAGRETGPGVVHLVGTAAGPLGGDDVTISVRVGPGARLAIRSAGATIIQPGGRRPDSRLHLELDVADGGELDFATEPTVICHGAEHEAESVIELAGSGRIRLLEQVLLGRSHEPGGDWIGRTRLNRDGTPVLRHTLRSTLLVHDGTRVIATLLHSGGTARPDTAGTARPATSGGAVAMPLAAGGLLVTATGRTLLPTHRDLLAAAALSRVGPTPALTTPTPA